MPTPGKGSVDKFHLIRHINGAVDKVRGRLQGGSRKGKKRDLFKSRYTLLKGVEGLADVEPTFSPLLGGECCLAARLLVCFGEAPGNAL